ncbi:hypothetical protein H8S95_07395 [Pontibacter sp. KCTC 32443]|uniref:hypothetical protein n=1 Tax=Pontibacter TaxID=323449 RepID=UPI00164D1207|nr:MULTISPECIES: hypothetical protein [Pontibacter]MBC5773883.1 hypothetical protein [Pontibacter sp. KCTC 32443]
MEYYWDTFQEFIKKLETQKHFELVEELEDAQKYVNGLTDGWYEFLNKLKVIYDQSSHVLAKDDSDKLKYLVESIDSMLNNR